MNHDGATPVDRPDLPDGPDPRVPHHRRTVTIEVFPAGDDLVDVVGRLLDERPWASDPLDLPVLHDLSLTVTVSIADFVVRGVRVRFDKYPHAECVDVAAAHRALVGVTLGRGWNAALRQRLGGPAGCTHLRELARAMAPVMLQAAFSAQRRRGTFRGEPAARALLPMITDTCHVWAEGGVAEQKLARGWRLGTAVSPVPALEQWPELLAED